MFPGASAEQPSANNLGLKAETSGTRKNRLLVVLGKCIVSWLNQQQRELERTLILLIGPSDSALKLVLPLGVVCIVHDPVFLCFNLISTCGAAPVDEAFRRFVKMWKCRG